MPAANQPFLFFMKLPDLKNLLTLHIDIRSIDKPSQRSLFHLQTLKCRELIFMESSCLASPMKFGMSHIKVIVLKAALDCIEFKGYTRKIGLEIVEIKETTPSALQECLQYTCLVKLAPEWNVLRDILVEGPGFLEANGSLSSVKMDIFASNTEISLCLQPSCIKLPPMKMEYYATSEQLATSFTIRLAEKCIVLPSLKTATVCSISRSPALSGTFKTYSEFQEHWKNMYGYILPNVQQQGIWYFNVTFRVPNATSYTYPQFCVRSHGPTVIPRVDPRPILCTFIKTFCKKVGNICGEKCRIIEGKASFPELELFPAAEVLQDMKPRPGTTYSMKPNVSYRKDVPKISSIIDNDVQSHHNNTKTVKDNIANCVSNHAPLVTSVTPLQSKNVVSERVLNNLTKGLMIHDSEKKLSQTIKSQESHGNIFKNLSTSSTNVPFLNASIVNSSEIPQIKYSPCFYPRKPKPQPKSVESAQPNVYVPQFFPKKRVLNPAEKIQTKCLQDSSACKMKTADTKIKSNGRSRNDPAQINSILSSFNVKKKVTEEKTSVKAVKGAIKKKRQMSDTSSSSEKKVNTVKKSKA